MIKSFSNEYVFLSNFYSSIFVLGGKEYFTNEHYYQSQKAANEDDREAIRNMHTPGQAKRLGRKIKIIGVWEETKEMVMETGLRAKFDQNPPLKEELIETGDQEIQEGNYWNDKEWGVCLKTGEGKNKLGKLLMKIREEYIKE